MNWLNVLRDVVVIYILLIAGYSALEAMAASGGLSVDATVLSAAIFTSVGFAVSGVLAPGPRWPHLIAVMVVAWLVSVAGVAFLEISFVEWLTIILPSLAVCMLVGGIISSLLPSPQGSSRSNQYLD